ncbi:MAG: M23 family metallopeptidase, partial [Gammaproteobacteria bacterium]
AKVVPVAPGTEITSFTVHRGDTLGRLLDANHLSATDLHTIMALGGDTDRLKRIRVGQVITISHDTDGRILGLSMKLDDAHMLEVARAAGGYQASVADIPTETSLAYAHGVIENSLFDAASRAGLSDPVTMQLINLFGWDIDFAHVIRSGDSFTVLYQKIHRQGEPVTDGPILAAEFVTPGKTYRIVRFTDPSGHTDYYTPDGRSVRKALLRAPVAYTRISSGFSLHRMNPVLHFVRPHYGVDYAAPTGTPIKAAGDGRIVFEGRKEGFGRCVIIKHGGGFSTLYAHMSHFRNGLHAGSHVIQDQVIGYVGMTGEATGPHLHFEILKDGVPRNPRTVELPSADPIMAKLRPDFTHTMDTLLAEMSNGGGARIATTAVNATAKVTTAH